MTDAQGLAVDRCALNIELQAAIRDRQFLTFAQPQVVVQGGRATITGHELLVRWNHPQRGVLEPSQFICHAEETGLIRQIDTWMLEQTCTLLATWKNDPDRAHLRLSVNISRLHFRDPDFASRVAKTIQDAGAPAERLTLEVTETMPLDDLLITEKTMRCLRKMGLALSLDDFGTGFSSHNLIQRLPFNEIKIDRSFIRELPANPRSSAILTNMIQLARALELGVIAEGVETRDQIRWLVGHDCHAAQGYLFGRPQPMPVDTLSL